MVVSVEYHFDSVRTLYRYTKKSQIVINLFDDIYAKYLFGLKAKQGPDMFGRLRNFSITSSRPRCSGFVTRLVRLESITETKSFLYPSASVLLQGLPLSHIPHDVFNEFVSSNQFL